MHNKKKYLSNIFLPIFFFVYWFLYNYRYVKPNSELSDTETMLSVNSDSWGYSCFIIVSTLFTVVYLLYINIFLPKLKDIEIIRYGKNNFIKIRIRTILTQSLVYAFLFEFINIIMNYLFLPYSLLNEAKFLFISGIHFLLLYIYFVLVGAVFLVIGSFTSFKNIAIWLTSFVFCGFFGLYRLFNVQGLPITDYCVFDYWFNGVFQVLSVIISIIKNAAFILIGFALAKNVFLSKDILESKSVKLKA